MKSIEINGNKLVTGGHSLAAFRPPSIAESNYILIEANEPFSATQSQTLKDKHVEILEYQGDEVYLCAYKPADLAQVKELDFIVDAVVYHPAYVVESGLKSGEGSEETAVEIALHDDVDAAGETKAAEQIAAKAGIDPSTVHISGGKAKIKVIKDKLADLANIDEIKTINQAHERKLFNNEACKIMEAHKPAGLNDALYKGKDQIVCVADTGFDTGSQSNHHEAFENRVLKLYPLGRPTEGKSDDPDGHGTHVCGSVLGKGENSEFNTVIEAPASEAKLLMQSVFTEFSKPTSNPASWEAGLGGIPNDPKLLFDRPFADGARIHTNSWGGPVSAYQDAWSGKIDGYLFSNQKLTVLFAAGNAGTDVAQPRGQVDPFSLSSESVCKNVISVGASENLRPNTEYPEGVLKYGVWTEDFAWAPIKNDPVADNPEGLAAFSSRGPTKPDGRIKPDVVAPGTTILSTKSSATYPGHFNPFWGISKDPKWCYEGGTSMATPLTAGCCAVIRGALEENNHRDPSAALVKAVLINGAVPLKGQYTNEFGNNPDPDAPNPHSGFGRVNVKNSLQCIVPGTNVQGGFGDFSGQDSLVKDGTHDKHDFAIEVLPSVTGGDNKPFTLKVTLVWTDPKGARLQNDLDLIVRNSDGVERHGNQPANSSAFDRVNNVEQVVWKNASPGTYTVTVKAYRIIKPQPFAYAWRVFSPAA